VGISPSEFWSLSWFEWGCYLLRLEKRIEKENFLWEESWEQTRIMWALTVNVNGNKFKPRDLIVLPRDKEEKKVELLKPEEVEKLFPKTLPNGK
jgi:hypothetical protein